MRDFLEILAIMAGGLAVMFLCGVVFVSGLDYADCSGFARGTGIQTRWEFGCYANVNGKWVPKSTVFGKANEIRLKEK